MKKSSAKAALDVWRDRALAVPGEVLSSSVPVGVLLHEAAIAAAFFSRRWKANGARAGLESAANASLTASTGRELTELQRAVDEADIAYNATPGRPPSAAIEARRVARDIVATLAWYLDDRHDMKARARLDALRSAHANAGRSSRALSPVLHDLARFAEGHRAALTGLGGFDPRQIDAALTLAARLREPARGPREQPAAKREALALRNKLVALLRDRLATVRAAARFVFRDHPEIIREITSEHERTRRKLGRAKKE